MYVLAVDRVFVDRQLPSTLPSSIDRPKAQHQPDDNDRTSVPSWERLLNSGR